MLGWYSRRSGSTTTYAPMRLYSQDNLPNDSGSTSTDAYKILTTQGITPRSQYPHGDYDWTTTPSASDRAAAAPNTTTAPHYLFRSSGSAGAGIAGRVAIETAVSMQHPVALGIPIFRPFYGLDRMHPVLRASDVTPSSTRYGRHEVLVVGYDSTGVRAQNQWGTSWGDGGYATLDWAFVQQYASEASWIYGFSKSLPATAPAQVDGCTSHVWTFGTTAAQVSATCRGTAEYDDSARHPVTGYSSTLIGSDGTTQTDAGAADDRVTSFRVDYGTAYTLSVVAKNAIGTGPARTFTFTPSSYGANAHFVSQRLDGTPLPSPAMPRRLHFRRPDPRRWPQP